MFGDKKKVEKKLDKPKIDDSDSEKIDEGWLDVEVPLEPDIDDLPEILSVDEETGEETELPKPVSRGGFRRE